MNEHDKVIEFIAKNLEPKYKVLSNPGNNKRWSIKGIFPDIIIKSQDDKVLFILEVETKDSLSSSISVQQWKNYINLPMTFYLIVPEEKINEAKLLTAQSGIKAKFGFYKYKDNKVERVIYE